MVKLASRTNNALKAKIEIVDFKKLCKDSIGKVAEFIKTSKRTIGF